MEAIKVAEYAQALYAAHGDKAEVEAARRANEALDAKKMDEAENWQAVRASIRRLRGPNQS
ncbi:MULTISPECIES: hypothetical protein [unclassified Tateyamaria]|jgi:hypothetical protein|uniref:hypothetical protein n=1 Tax=unclassified Tateyamaria TaxID=2645127 RepID=UPI000D55FBA4|nr:hypothetical protein [Tateyamaria sp. Alg231-49]